VRDKKSEVRGRPGGNGGWSRVSSFSRLGTACRLLMRRWARGDHWCTRRAGRCICRSSGARGFIRDFLSDLAGPFTLIRYDMRGGGLPDRDVPPFRFEELVDDFGELVDQPGLKKFPLMTLGGFAAPIAIGYAARHPERVERLVMHSSYAKGTLLGDPEERRVVADYTLNFGFPIFKFVDHPGVDIEQQRAMYNLHERAASHAMQAAVYQMMYDVDLT